MDSNLCKAVLQAATQILGKEDAEDICQDFWTEVLEDRLPAPEDSGPDWYLQQIRERAKKAANIRMKEGIKHLRYTDSPTHPTTPGEISDEQLEKLCSRVDLPEVTNSNKLSMMKTLFNSLAPADQEFLKAYQYKEAKELIPKYGKSVSAIRQRACRLRKHLAKSLAGIYGRK